MEFWFILAAGAVFLLSFIAYAALALFFPEWVGITGKVALDAEQSHKSGSDTKTTSWIEENKNN